MNQILSFKSASLLVAATTLIIGLSGCGQEAKVSSPEQVAAFKGDPSKMPADAKARMQGAPAQTTSTTR